jgi:hypothetical protein
MPARKVAVGEGRQGPRVAGVGRRLPREALAQGGACKALAQDNLDAQKQPEYIEFLRGCGVDDHKLPPNVHAQRDGPGAAD